LNNIIASILGSATKDQRSQISYKSVLIYLVAHLTSLGNATSLRFLADGPNIWSVQTWPGRMPSWDIGTGNLKEAGKGWVNRRCGSIGEPPSTPSHRHETVWTVVWNGSRGRRTDGSRCGYEALDRSRFGRHVVVIKGPVHWRPSYRAAPTGPGRAAGTDRRRLPGPVVRPLRHGRCFPRGRADFEPLAGPAEHRNSPLTM
jgi:hypothetical protein